MLFLLFCVRVAFEFVVCACLFIVVVVALLLFVYVRLCCVLLVC